MTSGALPWSVPTEGGQPVAVIFLRQSFALFIVHLIKGIHIAHNIKSKPSSLSTHFLQLVYFSVSSAWLAIANDVHVSMNISRERLTKHYIDPSVAWHWEEHVIRCHGISFLTIRLYCNVLLESSSWD